MILAFAVAVRLSGIGTLPIWLDEAFSYASAKYDWNTLWTVVPRFETHPVAWYSLVKLWMMLGDSEFILRLLPLILGLLAIPVTFVAGRAIGGTRVGLLAALLLAGSPFQIFHAQNLRPYTLVTLASAIVVASALHILRNPAEAAQPIWHVRRRSPAMLTAFAGLAVGWALLVWSHNLNILLCGAAGLYLAAWAILRRERTLAVNLGLSLLLAILLYSPNIPVILGQFDVVRGGWWLQPPTRWSLAFQTTELFGFPIYGIGRRWNALINFVLVAPFLLGAAAAIIMGLRRGDTLPANNMLFLAICALLPWAAAIILTYLVVPVFIARTLIMVQVPAVLLLATAASALDRLPSLPRNAAFFTLAAIPICVSLTFHMLDKRRFETDRLWGDIVAAVVRQSDEAVPVFTVPNAAALPLGYYADRAGVRLNLVPLPGKFPASGYRHYPTGSMGVPGIDPEHIAVVAHMIRGQSEVWYVRRNVRYYDPAGRVESFLGRHFPCKAIFRSAAKDDIVAAFKFYAPRNGRCA